MPHDKPHDEPWTTKQRRKSVISCVCRIMPWSGRYCSYRLNVITVIFQQRFVLFSYTTVGNLRHLSFHYTEDLPLLSETFSFKNLSFLAVPLSNKVEYREPVHKPALTVMLLILHSAFFALHLTWKWWSILCCVDDCWECTFIKTPTHIKEWSLSLNLKLQVSSTFKSIIRIKGI